MDIIPLVLLIGSQLPQEVCVSQSLLHKWDSAETQDQHAYIDNQTKDLENQLRQAKAAETCSARYWKRGGSQQNYGMPITAASN